MGFVFFAKGSHAKAYFPWKYPDVEVEKALQSPATVRAQAIFDSFSANIGQVYTERFCHEIIRRVSKSSAGTTSGHTYRKEDAALFDVSD